MAHVFIVNERTLNIHLKYMFAGTGAGNRTCDFLLTTENSDDEKTLVGMIADVSRIREGDNVIFYLQQSYGHDGTFFGSFKVKDKPFLCDGSYLCDELGKKLIFRVKLECDEVYPIGVTERESLDSLEGIEHPYELCWSLIYRKLKGNRGCTMITNYEYDRLMEKIRKVNNYKKITEKNLKYNKEKNIIEVSKEKNEYTGKIESLNVEKRLKHKIEDKKSCEAYLQAYIMQNYNDMYKVFMKKLNVTWIGNEMSCGVGMQSIDIVFVQENVNNAYIYICELKDEELYKNPNIIYQLEKYIGWMKDYILPTYKKKVTLCPVIICKKISDRARNATKEKDNKVYNKVKENITERKTNKFEIDEVQVIEYELMNDKIKFEKR